MANRLRDKVAIVTGGTAGIGRAVAEVFVAEGARVAVCGRRQEPLDDTLAALRAAGGEAIAVRCDVSDETDVERLIQQTVDAFGRLDVLVNNAGVRASILTIEDLSHEEWQRTFDSDAKGSWLCSKHAVPHMRKAAGGSIIMISSISAVIGQTKQGCYNAAKAAQKLLGHCMALDFAGDNIRVNSICPAWIRTEMNRDQLAEMEAEPDKTFPPGFTYRDVIDLHPLGRIGAPADVAWAAVYLASGESSWVTGTSLFVDGGYTCR